MNFGLERKDDEMGYWEDEQWVVDKDATIAKLKHEISTMRREFTKIDKRARAIKESTVKCQCGSLNAYEDTTLESIDEIPDAFFEAKYFFCPDCEHQWASSQQDAINRICREGVVNASNKALHSRVKCLEENMKSIKEECFV